MATSSVLTLGLTSPTGAPLTPPEWMQEEHDMGTTIIAVEFDGGVVLGADSRTSTGVYVANRVADKLTRVTERIYCCRSGSAADTQAITDIVSYHLAFHEQELNEPPKVKLAANVFRELCYKYRDQLTAGIIVGGWDKVNGGQVYCIPLGGMIVRQNFALGGSGSTYVYGLVDAELQTLAKEKGELKPSRADCIELVTKVVSCAMARDGSSGGLIRLAIIEKDGVERRVISGKDISRYYHEG
ncbi:unnamed protein product [Cyprideis torosa]|uniref:Proteasome subunit beta n=1 Tax=Cyprideis torosa TaxID=163714 RepID=A0A7R8WMD0_9CRUS|nr:unnamed protein product [Cyprideis torosa]CAG0898347.1 unnamed protein product [Cyprideis torosa]